MHTIIILAALCQAPILYYFDGPEKPEVVASLRDGWKTFDRITGTNHGATFNKVSKLEAAHVVIFTKKSLTRRSPGTPMAGSPSKISARVCKWESGAARIEIYLEEFSRVPRSQWHHVICHELAHYYGDCPDHYPGPDKHCLMGDFFLYGWPDRFCDSCLKRIRNAR